MNHVIYLKLRQNYLLLQAEQINLFLVKMVRFKKIIILSENIVILFSFQQELFLFQLDISHVIREPKPIKQLRCRAPLKVKIQAPIQLQKKELAF